MDNYDRWSPVDYLKQYYSTSEITLDEVAIADFVVRFLAEKNQKFTEVLEVGCGPTIHHVFPVAPLVDRVYMADFVESNLDEVQKWKNGNGHDWRGYLTPILALEGDSSEALLAERIKLLQSKIAGLLSCNALSEHPLGRKTEFPLVTSFYCLECIQQDKNVWRETMANVSSLLTTEGYIILSALHKADKYLVCGQEFPATHIDENDMRQTLIDCGFNPATIKLEVHPSGWTNEGFENVLIVSAQKK